MARRRLLKLAIVIIVLAALAAGLSFALSHALRDSISPGDEETSQPSLEEHLATEFARLKREKDAGSLTESEQAIADHLTADSKLIDFKAALLHELGIAVTQRLHSSVSTDRRVGSMTVLRLYDPNGTNGWGSLKPVLLSLQHSQPDLQPLYARIKDATTDQADEANYENIISSTADIERRVIDAAASGYIQPEKRSEIELLAELPRLALLLSMRARFLALMQSKNAMRGPGALWSAIAKLQIPNYELRVEAARAVSILLDDGAFQIFEDGMCGNDDLNSLANIIVEWPSPAETVLSAADDEIVKLEPLYQLLPEYDEEEINVRLQELAEKYGVAALQVWIDGLFSEHKVVVDQIIETASELDAALHRKDHSARQRVAAMLGRLEPFRARLEANLMLRLQRLYLVALACERSRVGDAKRLLSAQSVAEIVKDADYVVAAQSGTTISLRLNLDDPLAEFYPAECRDRIAVLKVE